jgi:hypothetical protein
MLRNLSPRELETLVKLGEKGPGGNFDIIALNKLFTLALITVSNDRRVELTEAGKDICGEIAKQPR